MKFVALVAVVPEEREEEAIDIAKGAGAGAVTIIHARTLGLKEKKIFFGLTLEENVTILHFILPRRISRRVLKALAKGLQMERDDNVSLVYTMALDHVVGINMEELQKFEREIKNLL
ncbi:transcriptional regulator [Hydrogenimonas urashimensis]|uniref:transcriptional regulator n=1 Tax=Hydrogenimonas urashimensis TaxID=2740515 RepID=UPI0019157A29|nr:transcriptional regulator [Hydrogenimonas urashimensis]